MEGFLSGKGNAIAMPKNSILSQTAEAKACRINATIGSAKEENNDVMVLDAILKKSQSITKDHFAYAPSSGKELLRKNWLSLIRLKNPSIENEISLPIVTSGITHGAYVIGHLFVDPSDEIIISDLFWENYELIFEHNFLAKLDKYNTFKKNKLDLESFEKKVFSKKGKTIILLNFPNNPSGYTPTDKEAEKIVSILKEHSKNNKTIVICDDAYFGLVYEKNIFLESIFAKTCSLSENLMAIKLDGLTKEDYVWGFRLGFITYGSKNMTREQYKVLEDKTSAVVRSTISNASNLAQSIVCDVLIDKEYLVEKKEKYNILKDKYDALKEALSNEKYREFFSVLPCNSGYFLCLELNKKYDPELIRKSLLQNYSTGVIVMNNLIRIAFSSVKKSDMETLVENIYEACKKLSNDLSCFAGSCGGASLGVVKLNIQQQKIH